MYAWQKIHSSIYLQIVPTPPSFIKQPPNGVISVILDPFSEGIVLEGEAKGKPPPK